MSLELTRVIASKFRGEVGTTSSIFQVADATTASLTISIPNGWTFYLIESGGYVTTSDVKVTFKDKHNSAIYEWAEYPDTFKTFDNLPFLYRSFKDSIKFTFANVSGATTNVCWLINGILIPSSEVDKFEKEVKSLVRIGRED